jgi:hypothetical protein
MVRNAREARITKGASRSSDAFPAPDDRRLPVVPIGYAIPKPLIYPIADESDYAPVRVANDPVNYPMRGFLEPSAAIR